MLKLAVDTRAQRRSFVTKFIALFSRQRALLIGEPRLHFCDFLERVADVDVLAHWFTTTAGLVWVAHFVVGQGTVEGIVIDWSH